MCPRCQSPDIEVLGNTGYRIYYRCARCSFQFDRKV